MKRLGLLLLAVVMVVGLAGCSDGDGDPNVDVTGLWTLAIDPYCDGSTVTARSSILIWRLYPDGTLKSFRPDGTPSHTGTYSVSGRKVAILYTGSTGTEVYTANADGTEMSNKYSNGDPSIEVCETAILTSRDPNAPLFSSHAPVAHGGGGFAFFLESGPVTSKTVTP